MQSSMLLLFLPRILHSESVGSHVGLLSCIIISLHLLRKQSLPMCHVPLSSWCGESKQQSSMFVPLLTAGADNNSQTGVFVIKVRSTGSKSVSSWGLYESSKYR